MTRLPHWIGCTVHGNSITWVIHFKCFVMRDPAPARPGLLLFPSEPTE